MTDRVASLPMRQSTLRPAVECDRQRVATTRAEVTARAARDSLPARSRPPTPGLKRSLATPAMLPFRITALAVMLLPAAGAAPAESLLSMERLAWLGGCWAADGGEAGSGEHWMPLAGDTLLGISRTVKRGRTVEHEFMQIRRGDDGRIAFVAQPSGQHLARFPVARLSADEVVFENLEHDFPQRISYRRTAGDWLLARVEGLRQGTLRSIDFPMRKVACDALGDVAVPAPSGREPAIPQR